MMNSSKNPEEETKMISKLFGKKEVTVEQEITKQAAQITKMLARLDALEGKAGN